MAKILAFSGSAREGSFNQQLVTIAAESACRAGAEVTLINLKDYPLPLFDQDLEKKGLPDNVLKLKSLFLSHQGLLISCPEYNSGITPLLKNTIDWVSRQDDLACYKNKVATLLSASPGALGGIRGLPFVRHILSNIGVTVLPDQMALSKAGDAFETGSLKDPKQKETLDKVVGNLVKMLNKLA